MTTRDIQSFLREKYDIDVSLEFVSSVSESVSAGVQEWRRRPLQAVWPILYLDALFLKARDEGRVVKKALYIAVGVNLEGSKELLGLWPERRREVICAVALRPGLAGRGRHLHRLRGPAQ